MEQKEIEGILEEQRRYFATGETLSVAFRKRTLQTLYAAVQTRETEIAAALRADLGKSATESYMCEIGMCLSEIRYLIKHLRRFARKKRVHTPLAQFAAKSYVLPCPYGNTLIMSPWNYPFLLSIEPLADALAAGNTVVLKPSAYAPRTSELLADMLASSFPTKYVTAVTGGRAENACLLEQSFDFVFFTGSQAVGKEVLRHTAERLTPAVLELGGKSPCIVDETAKLPLAAKRIVFGKFLNCGQTCVAPDYVLCHASVKEELLQEIRRQVCVQYGKEPLKNLDYGKIVNEKHFERLCGLIDETKIAFGGGRDALKLQIEPTVLDGVELSDAVMQEEIFGPILPILTYENFEEAYALVERMQKPLALYLFSENRRRIKEVTRRLRYGGGCINDTVIHLASSELGFGGVGESGMGAYHGKTGFDTFSHKKSIVDKKTFVDMPIRYQPYKKGFFAWLLRIFMR